MLLMVLTLRCHDDFTSVISCRGWGSPEACPAHSGPVPSWSCSRPGLQLQASCLGPGLQTSRLLHWSLEGRRCGVLSPRVQRAAGEGPELPQDAFPASPLLPDLPLHHSQHCSSLHRASQQPPHCPIASRIPPAPHFPTRPLFPAHLRGECPREHRCYCSPAQNTVPAEMQAESGSPHPAEPGEGGLKQGT